MDKTKFKLIIFDLDDCLVDTWSATFPKSILSAIKAMEDKGLKVKSPKEAAHRLNEINNRSRNSVEAIVKYLNEINEDIKKYTSSAKRAIHDFALRKEIRPLPGVINMIEGLKKLELVLVIVTKGERERQLRKIRDSGIDIFKFEKIVVVDDYNKTKPYSQILKEYNFNADNILVVGDRYKTDLMPATKLGMKTAWIHWGRGKIYIPDKNEVNYKIKKMTDILSIVKKN